MSVDKKIEDLEALLRPKLVFLSWVEKTLKAFSSRAEHVIWCMDDLTARAPLVELAAEFERSNSSGKKAKWRQQDSPGADEQIVVDLFCFWNIINRRAVKVIGDCEASVLKVAAEVKRLRNEVLQPTRFTPVPLSEEMAAVVQAAINDYVVPPDGFFPQLISSIRDQRNSSNKTEENPDEERSRICATVVAAIDAIYGSKIDAWVDLGSSPYRSLGRASLVDRRWIDQRLVELAEYAALLESYGYRFAEMPGNHPLEELIVKRSDGQMACEDELLPIREEARLRLKTLNATTKRIGGQVYLELDDYRAWSERGVISELVPIPGFAVSRWKQCLAARGGELRALLDGIDLPPLRTPFCAGDFVARHDDGHLAARRGARLTTLLMMYETKPGSPAEPVDQIKLRKDLGYLLFAFATVDEFIGQAPGQFGGREVIFNDSKERLTKLAESIFDLVLELYSMGIEWFSLEEVLSSGGVNCPAPGNHTVGLNLADRIGLNPTEMLWKQVRQLARADVLAHLGLREEMEKKLVEGAADHLKDIDAALLYLQREHVMKGRDEKKSEEA